MSAIPTKIDNNGIELIKPNDDLTITLTPTNGLDIEYDLNSAPKEFKLNENGVYWTNGVDTFQTSLNRLCAVEQAFTSIELPPTPNVLQVNDTITITDGTLETNTITNTQIVITDGTTTNTINKNGYTTRNSVQNITHYLNFSDSSATGTGAIQKTAGLSCNPSTNSITATTFNGNLSGNISVADENTSATYYPVFVSSTGNQALKIDSVTNPFSINPNTGAFNLSTTMSLTGTGGTSRVAVGLNAGNGTNSGITCVGAGAGALSPAGQNATCIGFNAGANGVGARNTFIGAFAGQNVSGVNAIAIGYNACGSGTINNNCIVLDAKLGANIVSTGGADRLYIDPIRLAGQATSLGYDVTTKEITYYTSSLQDASSYINYTNADDMLSLTGQLGWTNTLTGSASTALSPNNYTNMYGVVRLSTGVTNPSNNVYSIRIIRGNLWKNFVYIFSFPSAGTNCVFQSGWVSATTLLNTLNGAYAYWSGTNWSFYINNVAVDLNFGASVFAGQILRLTITNSGSGNCVFELFNITTATIVRSFTYTGGALSLTQSNFPLIGIGSTSTFDRPLDFDYFSLEVQNTTRVG